MSDFSLNVIEMERLEAMMQCVGISIDSLRPICVSSLDCNPKNYTKAECHGCNEIVEL